MKKTEIAKVSKTDIMVKFLPLREKVTKWLCPQLLFLEKNAAGHYIVCTVWRAEQMPAG